MKLLYIFAILNAIIFIAIGAINSWKLEKVLPKSISLTYYYVAKAYFVWFLLSSAGAISVFNLTLLPDQLSITNIGAWLLAGVGFFSNIKNENVLKIHMACAFGGFITILVGMWIDFGQWVPLITAAIMAIPTYALTRKRAWSIWLIEIELIAAMFYGYHKLIM